MTLRDESYIDQLVDARAEWDVWRLDVDEPFRLQEREHFRTYSDHWARMVGLAIRALGQGADVRHVADKLLGRPLLSYQDVTEFTRILTGHLDHWVLDASGIHP